jgi:arylsulfatase A-like enzyme
MRIHTRREFLGAVAAGPLLSQAKTKKPNVVLVLFDDLGWKDFSCYGSTVHDTPNIDAIAREGARFTAAYAACPVCSPTRSAILTGKYPVRTGVTDWIPGRAQWPTAKLLTPRTGLQMKLEERTLAEALRESGYRTASIGKWHLGAGDYLPTAQGFDANVGGNAKGSNGYFGPFDLPGLEGRTKENYLTDELQAAARSFAAGGGPFFLYSPNYSVHTPIQAPADRIQKAPGRTETQMTYKAMLEITDEHIGRLRQQLKAAGEYENTIWVITSDNGGLRYEGKNPVPFTDNSPLRAGKGHLYEGGVRVPLLIAAPGRVRAGLNLNVPACSVDVAPTLLELLGEKPLVGIDGKSLVPVLRGGKIEREALYWHYPHYSNQGGVPGGAIREGRWKLIEFYEDGRLELFDLQSDPGETKNLAVRERERAARLRAKLDAWRKGNGAVMPTVNPAFDPAKADQGLVGVEPVTAPV